VSGWCETKDRQGTRRRILGPERDHLQIERPEADISTRLRSRPVGPLQMNIYKCIAFGICALLYSTIDSEGDRVGDVVAELQDHGAFAGIGNVTPDIRDKVIERLRMRTAVAFVKAGPGTRIVYLQLTRLGDSDATKQVVEAVHSHSRERDIEYSVLEDFLVEQAQPARLH